MENDIELTELVDLNVTRQDGVENPASGFSFLIQKAAKPSTGLSESKAKEEACESDQGDEEAFERGENKNIGQDEKDDNAAKQIAYEAVEGFVYKRDFSTAERKKLASEGKALSNGSYPIENEEDLKNAAHLAESGHGDVAAAKRLIARRAKELGVPNPLDKNDDEKAEKAEETSETAEAPETIAKSEHDAAVELLEKSIAEAKERAEAAEGREAAVKAELEALKATPLPGGPVLAATAADRDFKVKSEALSKAAYFRSLADKVADRELQVEYMKRAAEFSKQAA